MINQSYDTIIIGAGISGLTVAKHIKNNYLIIEKNNECGGLSSQYSDNGYDFDYGGHYFHFQNKEHIYNYIKKYSNFKKYIKNSKVYVLNKYLPFPVQYHLSFFPYQLKKNILNEIIYKRKNNDNSINLEEYLINSFGKSLYNVFFKPFLSKYYNMELKQLIHSKDKGSIPIPNQKEVLDGYNGKKFEAIGYNPAFYYPENALKHFINNFSQDLEKNILYNTEVIKIDIKNKIIYTNNSQYQYKTLINTMPLKKFLKISINKNIDNIELGLKNISTLITNVVLQKRRKRFHWAYLPDKKYPFYRFGYYPGQDKITGYLEQTITNNKTDSKGDLDSVINTLKTLGVVKYKDEIKFISNKFIPVSYILFDKEWENIVPQTLKKLKSSNIYSIGRYGSWDYTSMSDDIQNAIKTAEEINNGR